MTRQQILYLWLAESAIDTSVVGWAFHDGTAGPGPSLPGGEPPYSDGVAALKDGWLLLQSPSPSPVAPDPDQGTSGLRYEFVFERRFEDSG